MHIIKYILVSVAPEFCLVTTRDRFARYGGANEAIPLLLVKVALYLFGKTNSGVAVLELTSQNLE
jgi:hypothetical protein